MEDLDYAYYTYDLINDYIDDYYMDEKWVHTKTPEYLVSNKGRVYSIKSGKIMAEKNGDKQGHKSVSLSTNGKKHYHYIHRLVADAFIDNVHEYPIVRHLNDDRNNNSVENLSWGTQKDNHNDSVRNGTFRPFTNEDREIHLSKQRTPIRAIFKNGDIKEFSSQAEASKKLNLHQSNIHKALVGNRIHTGGIRFEYI